MQGFLVFVVVVAVIWIGGCSVNRYQTAQREEIYGEVWATAPDLERAHSNVSTELKRLDEIRRDLVKRKSYFESEQARGAADREIAGVDRQIERLEARRMDIIGAVEQQSLVNRSTKFKNPLQREKIASLESAATEAVRDAVSVRRAIETGVASDSAAVIPSRPSGNTGITPGPRPDQMKAPRPVPSRSRDDLLKMRTWRDRHGHNVTATLISVMDPRGRTVETLGRDPAALYRGGLTVHLQRNDGKIIQVPIAKFSEDDIIFLARGR